MSTATIFEPTSPSEFLGVSDAQAHAIKDAKRGLLYRTSSGWRRKGGPLIYAITVTSLEDRGILRKYKAQSGHRVAILTQAGLVCADMLAGSTR